MGSEAWAQCLKERARNRDACCLMDGFLLSITDRMSSDRFCRVVCNHRWAARENQRCGDTSCTGAGGRTVRKMASMASWRACTT